LPVNCASALVPVADAAWAAVGALALASDAWADALSSELGRPLRMLADNVPDMGFSLLSR
jgi:hypothetical protein